ncbi:MAG: ABC transporter ATP-binding protein [Lachnospiraceae bacterium]|nr:ABC transporter ATP-binding protein [Lachnospiraceae bacterium]
MTNTNETVSLVRLKNLSKKYPAGPMAVNDVSLRLESGKIIGLLGPNGSGKTTLIKMLNGLLKPSSGTILIDGNRPGEVTKKIVSYLPEHTYLPENMKVKDVIEYFADFYADFKTERAYEMLSSLQIGQNSYLKTLSKGTKEKVQLILVMSRDAKLFILDEPIAGVDPAARDYIIKTILANYNENATILLSTHIITDIENILDEVVILENGKAIVHSTVEEIREQKGKSIDAYFREVFSC